MAQFDLTDMVLALDDVQLRRLIDALDAEPPDPRFSPDMREAMLVLVPAALLRKYEVSRRADLLGEAISRLRALVSRGGLGDEENSYVDANLATALLLEYQRTGEASTLEEAIAASRASLSFLPLPGDERAGRLFTLAHLLTIRGSNYNSAGDLNRAIEFLEQSVRVDDASAEKLAECWSNLAGALRDKFRRDRDTAALDRAITALREAVRLAPPGSTLEQINKVNLAGAVRDHASATRNIAELDGSISDIEATIQSLPHDDPKLADYLYSLGMGYLTRHRVSGGTDDLRRAQATLHDALEKTGTEQQVYASIAMNLVEAFARDEDRSDQALPLLDTIADYSSAPAGIRFDAARIAGQIRLTTKNYPDALLSWEKAVNLLPVVAWRGSSYPDREAAVGRSSGTATTAAACAIALGRPAHALDMLELGRGVLWSHLLDARADLERVRAVRPDLADKLETARAILDTTHHHLAPEHTSIDDRMTAAAQWEQTIAEVRSIDGLQDFLLAPDRSRLASILRDRDALVVVNVSAQRCDALAITSEDIAVIPLPALSEKEATARVQDYLDALQDPNGQEEQQIHATLGWLWDAIAEPILHALGLVSRPPEDAWPRIWWCPTGPLAILPMHAAGYHSAERSEAADSVIDRCVSSYAPTLHSLARSHKEGCTPEVVNQTPKMLVVGIADTPGAESLPGVRDECDAIQNTVPADDLVILTDAAATRAEILSQVADAPFFHASCHGDQNLTHPSEGGILPYDWESSGLITIRDLSPVRHSGQFAYLSACMTAVGGSRHLDEFISLAGALHFTGWVHVVATLWTVPDRPAFNIARDTYSELCAGGSLDVSRTALALHQAVRRQRDRSGPANPSHWIQFIHLGP